MRDCWKKTKKKKGGKGGGGKNGNGKEHEEVNVIAAIFPIIEEVDEAIEVDEEMYNFNTYNGSNAAGIDECTLYYDWLGDSATTFHVVAQQEAFTLYTPVTEAEAISGMGGMKARIAGCGTIEVISMCNSQEYILELHDVLHVPSNQNNLIS